MKKLRRFGLAVALAAALGAALVAAPPNQSAALAGNGDGNACRDQTVIASSQTIIKVKACVGQTEISPGNPVVYHYAFIRCGKPASLGGGYWSDCNFGVHKSFLFDNPGSNFYAVEDAAVLGVSTWTYRGPTLCSPQALDFQAFTDDIQGDTRGFEVRNNNTGEAWLNQGRSYLSNLYTGYPGC